MRRGYGRVVESLPPVGRGRRTQRTAALNCWRPLSVRIAMRREGTAQAPVPARAHSHSHHAARSIPSTLSLQSLQCHGGPGGGGFSGRNASGGVLLFLSLCSLSLSLFSPLPCSPCLCAFLLPLLLLPFSYLLSECARGGRKAFVYKRVRRC